MKWIATGYIFASIVIGSCAYAGSEILSIGNQRQLLVDDFLVEKLNDAVHELHHPVAREIAFRYDQPWEGNVSCYITIFKDDDTYRMYYRSAHAVFHGVLGTKRKGHAEFTCMAESADGIHWVRPELGLVEFEGSKANNIIPVSNRWTHCFTPFKDANPNCPPEELYKAVAYDHGNIGLHAFKSADGIHWSMIGDGPIITKGRFDSQNLAFYDAERSCYVAYIRDNRNGCRDIAVTTSPDFRNWSTPQFLIYNKDARDEQLYTNAILRYERAPQYLFGFPMRFHDFRLRAGNLLTGLGDGIIMTSRDGLHFRRSAEAFKRPGRNREAWFNRNNYAAWGIIETPGEWPESGNDLSIFYSEGFAESNEVKLRRYTLRPDGFISINAPASGGTLLTRPVRFTVHSDEKDSPAETQHSFAPSIAANPPEAHLFGKQSLHFSTPGVLEIPQTKELGNEATFALTVGLMPRGEERRFFSAHDKDKVNGRNLFCFHIYLAPTPDKYKYSLLRCWYSAVGKVEIKGAEFEKIMASSNTHHFASTYNHGKMKLYIDGKCVSENNKGQDLPLVFHLGNLRLGGDYPPNGLFNCPFIGFADDILIAKRVLDDSEITRLAASGAAATLDFEKEIGILYTMEEKDSGSIVDKLPCDGRQNPYPPAQSPNGRTMLFLNCETAALGSIRVELRDVNNQALPGYALDDCDVIYDDMLERVVSWHGKAETSELAKNPVKLFFELKDADLYSFRFGGRQHPVR